MKTAQDQTGLHTADHTGAILAMCLAMAFFIVSDTFSKLAAATVPVGQLLTVRAIYAALIFAVPVVTSGALSELRERFSRLWALRILGEMGAAMTFLAALAHLPIANVTTIIQTSPLATTAAAAILLRERVSTGQWIATVIGFFGAVLIIQPGTGAFSWWSLVALASVGCAMTRDLVTRRMDHTIPSSLVNASTSLGVVAAGLGLSAIERGWVWPDLTTHVYLIGSAAGIALAYHFLILAIRKAPISAVAPFRYTIVPMSILVGWFVWQEVPESIAFAGTAIICAAGLYTFLSQGKRPR